MSRKNHTRGAGSLWKSRPLRVLVDMDGVLCDFEGSFLDKYCKKYPDEPHVPLSERDGFYIDSQYRKLRADLQEKTWDIIEMEGFFEELPPIEGAIDAVKEMSGMHDVEVFICSSPLTSTLHSVREKFEWVRRYLGHDWIGRMVLSRDKTIVSGDILIEDRPRIKGVEKCPTWDHVLFSACHNVRLDITRLPCSQRLNNWTDGTWRKLIEDYKQKL